MHAVKLITWMLLIFLHTGYLEHTAVCLMGCTGTCFTAASLMGITLDHRGDQCCSKCQAMVKGWT